MRKITFLTLLLIASFALFSQTSSTVDYFNWSDPNTYQLSPSPAIKGYGFYSDSLSNIFDGKPFYVHNNEYYGIESWADYYYWFVKAYKHSFEDPQLYEYYYWNKDDYGMASYIASNKYLGTHYPSSIQIAFNDKSFDDNRLTHEYKTKKSDKEIEQLNKQLLNRSYKTSIKNTENQPKYTSPQVFKKEEFRKTKLKQPIHKIQVKESGHSASPKETKK